jgi:polyferredoxin
MVSRKRFKELEEKVEKHEKLDMRIDKAWLVLGLWLTLLTIGVFSWNVTPAIMSWWNTLDTFGKGFFVGALVTFVIIIIFWGWSKVRGESDY